MPEGQQAAGRTGGSAIEQVGIPSGTRPASSPVREPASEAARRADLDGRWLASLQRRAGNRAVAALVTGGRSATVQRQAYPHGTDPELVKRLDALVDRVAAEVGAFAAYKLRPLDGDALPGLKVLTAASRFLDKDPLESWMKGYARNRLGPANLKLLQEMIGMNGVGFNDFDRMFGVSYQDAAHAYTCNLKAAATLKEKVIEKFTPTVTITYSNAFGWRWTRDYRLAGVEFSAGLKVSKEGKKKAKPGGAYDLGPIELEITGTARADPTPIRYWGGDDFEGGVKVLKTAVKGSIGPAGGTLGGLTALTFSGGPFGTISFPFVTRPSGSISGGKGVSAEVNIGMGVGMSTGVGDTDIDEPPELKEEARAMRTFYTLTLNIGPFGTGEAVPPRMAAGALQELRQTFDTWRAKVLEPAGPDLRRNGIDPDANYRFTLYLTGTTSRSWRGAASEKQRLERNAALGLERARAVEPLASSAFAGVLRGLHAASGGTATLGPYSDDQERQVLGDEGAEQALEQQRAEAMREADPEDRRTRLKGIEANLGRQSDQPFGRRVHVMARWEGYLIIKALVPAAPSPGP